MYTAEIQAQIEEKQQQVEALRSEMNQLKRSAAMPVQDYELRDFSGNPVKLSAAFGDKDQLVLIHNMGFRCPYCTMWADGFNGLYKYVQVRAGFVLVSNDPPEKQQRGAGKRGWTFPMLSAQGTTLFKDLGFSQETEGQFGMDWPGVSTLQKHADGSITRTAADTFGPGDMYNSVWPLFELLAPGTEDIEPTTGLSDQAV
jgi:predicted dithiol-disulfide oxidoreductase (DUF899 family)